MDKDNQLRLYELRCSGGIKQWLRLVDHEYGNDLGVTLGFFWSFFCKEVQEKVCTQLLYEKVDYDWFLLDQFEFSAVNEDTHFRFCFALSRAKFGTLRANDFRTPDNEKVQIAWLKAMFYNPHVKSLALCTGSNSYSNGEILARLTSKAREVFIECVSETKIQEFKLHFPACKKNFNEKEQLALIQALGKNTYIQQLAASLRWGPYYSSLRRLYAWVKAIRVNCSLLETKGMDVYTGDLSGDLKRLKNKVINILGGKGVKEFLALKPNPEKKKQFQFALWECQRVRIIVNKLAFNKRLQQRFLNIESINTPITLDYVLETPKLEMLPVDYIMHKNILISHVISERLSEQLFKLFNQHYAAIHTLSSLFCRDLCLEISKYLFYVKVKTKAGEKFGVNISRQYYNNMLAMKEDKVKSISRYTFHKSAEGEVTFGKSKVNNTERYKFYWGAEGKCIKSEKITVKSNSKDNGKKDVIMRESGDKKVIVSSVVKREVTKNSDDSTGKIRQLM